MIEGSILLTGGAGTLGTAIIRRAREENWPCSITVYSTDAMKHAKLRSKYPDVHCVVGDVRDYNSLLLAMTGKEYVLHLAAVKHIDVSEYNSIDTFQVNVEGSLNICMAAMQLNTPHVLGISTDKAAHPCNCYGATKMINEKIWQEYSRLGLPTQFHLVRYGNVVESTGSVIEAWHKAVAAGQKIKITDPNMKRFWLSPSKAVDYVLQALGFPSGNIYIPRMSALSIGKLAEYTVGKEHADQAITIPIRPGEKMAETLLTCEEGWYASMVHWEDETEGYDLRPTTTERNNYPYPPYDCDVAPELTKDELIELLKND